MAAKANADLAAIYSAVGSGLGGSRVLDMLVGDPLPRIC